MTDKKVLKFGLKRSTNDDRDHVYLFFEYEKIPLPLQFSLADTKEIKIFDQMELNSCSSNSVCNQIMLSNDKIKDVPSRLFLYWNSRKEDIEEDHHSIFIEDTGASLRNTYKSLMKHNILPEIYYQKLMHCLHMMFIKWRHEWKNAYYSICKSIPLNCKSIALICKS